MYSTDVVNGLECLVDWLGFTFFEFGGPLDVVSYLGFKESDFSVSRGRSGYKSSLRHNLYAISVLYDGSGDMGIHVDISGSAISPALDAFWASFEEKTPWGTYVAEYPEGNVVVSYLRHILECGKMTRIDLAVDDKGGNYYSLEDLIRISQSGRCVSRFTKVRRNDEWTNGTSDVTGNTLYFGSRQSSAMLRVYDKRLEQSEKEGVCIDYEWVRWEMELKKDRAQTAAQLIACGESLGSVIVGILSNYIRIVVIDDSNRTRCTTDPLWAKFLEGIQRLKMTVARSEKSIEEIKAWLKKYVMPSLSLVVANDGGDLGFIVQNLWDALFKNSKTKLDRLFSLHPELKEEFVL